MQTYISLVTEIAEPFHVVDSSGKVVSWNRAAADLFGFSAAEAVGQPADSLLGTPPATTGELDATTKDGSTVHIHRRRTLIEESGKPIGEVIHDVDTQEQSRQQQVQRRRQRLESLGTLSSSVAHDLNNLLTPILMSCKMLQRDNPNVDRAALLDTISSGATRGADLIAQLLTFARGGEGSQTEVNLRSFMPEIIAILERAIPKQIHLTLELADDVPVVIGDETELSQVVMNLAINARDAMPGGGRLTITVGKQTLTQERPFTTTVLPPGEYVAITVADNGVGIASDIRDKIFDPFFSTKQRGQGTGLGLSTTIGIVKSHRGAIGVKSQVDQGTTVTVLLPKVTNVAARPSSSHAPRAM